MLAATSLSKDYSEDENIPMELKLMEGEPPVIINPPKKITKKKMVPLAKSTSLSSEGVGVAHEAGEIRRLTKEIDDGTKKLTDLNNPLNKDYNKLLLKKEILERASILEHSNEYEEHLYPTLNDPQFNTKIALRKEFYDTKMDVDNDEDVEEKAEMLCNAPFELAPNQQFVRNFLSVETPYNSLLLYH